ncbi:unnamed protein product [Cercospora beticola]|nr:unnamed protein product [Cercospora beticola]
MWSDVSEVLCTLNGDKYIVPQQIRLCRIEKAKSRCGLRRCVSSAADLPQACPALHQPLRPRVQVIFRVSIQPSECRSFENWFTRATCFPGKCCCGHELMYTIPSYYGKTRRQSQTMRRTLPTALCAIMHRFANAFSEIGRCLCQVARRTQTPSLPLMS